MSETPQIDPIYLLCLDQALRYFEVDAGEVLHFLLVLNIHISERAFSAPTITISLPVSCAWFSVVIYPWAAAEIFLWV